MKDDAITLVRSLLGNGATVTGSALAAKLKEAGIVLSFGELGFRNLREFVLSEVPESQIVGRSGMDLVYGMRGTPYNTNAVETDRSDFWRIWVSPNSPIALLIAIASGAVSAINRRQSVPVGFIKLEPPDALTHRSIARCFSATLSEPEAAPLLEICREESREWRYRWNEALRKTPLFPRWMEFRREEFQKRLEESLQQAGLERSSIDFAVGEVLRSHERARSDVPVERDHENNRRSVKLKIDDMLLRQVVLEIIDRMGVDELRSLRLPVGAVIDAIERAKK